MTCLVDRKQLWLAGVAAVQGRAPATSTVNQPGLPGVKQKIYRAVYRAIYRVYRELTGPTGPRFIYREQPECRFTGKPVNSYREHRELLKIQGVSGFRWKLCGIAQ